MSARRAMIVLALSAASASGSVVFQDGFETADFSRWPFDVESGFALYAAGHTGSYSAYTLSAGDPTFGVVRRAASFAPIPVDQRITFSYWFYDELGESVLGRQFCEIRSYTGESYGSGALDQLFAIGIYNQVTLPGETVDRSYYQGRVTFGAIAGWFNLSGAAQRSVGWHEFKVVVDGGAAEFYVDGTLGRTITGAVVATIDTVVLGSGLSSSGHAGYYDDFRVETSCAGSCCPADFNHANGVTVQDIFDFLTAWLAGNTSADFNHINGVTVQDIFDFLTAWLAGC